MPSINKALILAGEGQPLSLVERPIPAPGRGQLLVRNRATSLNYHDLMNCTGGMPWLAYPRVPFSDGCAEVLELGEGSTGFAPGDRVVPNFFPFWLDGDLDARSRTTVIGDQIDGLLQQYLVVEAASTVKAPAHLSDREAATLGCAGVTAWRSVVVEARTKPGDVVLIQGTGGVSLFALAFAKMAGATVILTSSSDEKLERAKALGADHVHNYRRDPAWDRFATEVTDGHGADLVVDIGGRTTLPLAFRAAALNGHVSMIGILTGMEQQPELPVQLTFSKNLTIKGITVGSARHLADMCRAIGVHGLRPVIDHAMPFERTVDALEEMKAQNHVGKIVIDID